MTVTRITPKLILCGLAIHLSLWLAVSLPAYAGLLPRQNLLGWAIRLMWTVLALAIAARLCLVIAKEHRNAKWLQIAWWAFAVNAALSVFRMMAENPVSSAIWPAYTSQLRGLWQHVAIVPGNLALLIGVIAICHAYHKVGLGFEIERRDFVLMAIIAAVLSGLMVFREGLTEANSPYEVSRYLQNIGLVCLAIVSAVSVVLHRMAMQMGGGRLALVLRLLTFYSLLRSVLVLVGALRPVGIMASIFLTLSWQVLQWLPALAASYRAEMTFEAGRDLQRLDHQAPSPSAVFAPELLGTPK